MIGGANDEQDMEFSMSCSVVLLGFVLLWNVTLVVFAQPGAADGLRAFKLGVGDPPELRSWRGDPCLVSWRGVKCGVTHNVVSLKLSALGLTGLISSELEKLSSLVLLWLDGNHLTGSIPPGLGNLKNLTSLRLSGNNLNGEVPATFASLTNLKELFVDGNQLSGSLPYDVEFANRLNIKLSGNADLCTSSLQNCGPSLSPALVFEGAPQTQQEQHHSSNVGAIAGAVAGAVVLVAVSIGLVSFCLMRVRRSPNASSDSASSDPSAQDWAKGPESLVDAALASGVDTQHVKQFSYLELDHATKGFNPSNMIGKGRFGFVYKGLLEDGTIVAIKTRASSPTQEFIVEALSLSQIRHRNIVSLLGFCQEHEQQMVVYDYLPNGSVCSRLYDSNGNPTAELDFKQRISIAVGAAKGLEHLHTSAPSRVHQDFKTSNVLLDENLMTKVADCGLSKLLVTSHAAMPSSNGAGTSGFSDPASAVYNSRTDPRSDVYSYGVFLFELVSGREAVNHNRPQSSRSIVEWAWSLKDLDNIEAMVEPSLVGTSPIEDVRTVLTLGLKCTAESLETRPTMSEVAKQLEDILDKERRGLSTAEAPTIVTLGSELFT